MRDFVSGAYKREANYAAGGNATTNDSRFSMSSWRAPAAYDSLVPLDKVPTTDFHNWLGTSAAAEFAASTANFGDKPISQTMIGGMLAEVEVFSRSFEFMRDGRRKQMRVYDLVELERVWGERRSSS